ncbi:UDP-N-acetyl-D-mannosamine dehydrogenase [compost metagenome]
MAFKPDIDDLRESPSLEITLKIAEIHPGNVLAVEPNIESLPASLKEAVILCDVDQALTTADVVVLLVDHSAFKGIPKDRLSSVKIIDTRGIWT